MLLRQKASSPYLLERRSPLRNFWLGEDRGHAADWTTQLWVKATGRRVDLMGMLWLDGPIGRSSGFARPCVRVVFPLPNGNAMAFLRPDVDASGALTVTSAGRRFGEPGFYFSVHERQRNRAWVRYVRTMQESIRVYAGDGRDVRADHTMRIWGATFLRLHYRLRPRAHDSSAAI